MSKFKSLPRCLIFGGHLIFLIAAIFIQNYISHISFPANEQLYHLSPIQKNANSMGFGAIIEGLDLCSMNQQAITTKLITSILNDLYHFEYLILKNQCMNYKHRIPPKVLTDFACLFGDISDYGLRFGHKADPNLNITSFSNDESHGITVIGSNGWHIDGTGDLTPNSMCFQYPVSIALNGNGGTEMISSKRLLHQIKKSNVTMYHLMQRLYVLKGDYVQPLIAIHPITNSEYIIIHTAFTLFIIEVMVMEKSLVLEIDEMFRGKKMDQNAIKWLMMEQKFGSTLLFQRDKRLKVWSKQKIKEFIEYLLWFIRNEASDQGSIHRVMYSKGDLLIRDNLAVLHKGHSSTQNTVESIGLRVMWRVALQGDHAPTK